MQNKVNGATVKYKTAKKLRKRDKIFNIYKKCLRFQFINREFTEGK